MASRRAATQSEGRPAHGDELLRHPTGAQAGPGENGCSIPYSLPGSVTYSARRFCPCRHRDGTGNGPHFRAGVARGHVCLRGAATGKPGERTAAGGCPCQDHPPGSGEPFAAHFFRSSPCSCCSCSWLSRLRCCSGGGCAGTGSRRPPPSRKNSNTAMKAPGDSSSPGTTGMVCGRRTGWVGPGINGVASQRTTTGACGKAIRSRLSMTRGSRRGWIWPSTW